MAMLGLVGLTPIDSSVAFVTVAVVVPLTPPCVAVIVLWPGVSPVASPLLPAALLIVATPVLDDAQVTELVRSWVVLSEYVPVATNGCVEPWAMLGLVGVTLIDFSVAALTVSVVAPLTPPWSAVIVL